MRVRGSITILVTLLFVGIVAADDPAPDLGVVADDRRDSQQDLADLEARLAEVEAAFRAEWGGVDASELLPAPVEDVDNRATLILAASRELQARSDTGRSMHRLWADVQTSFSVDEALENASRLESDFARYAEALSLLDGIEARSRSSFGLRDDGDFRAEGVTALNLVDLNRLISAQALHAVARGRHADVFPLLERLRAMADAYAVEPSVTLQLVREDAERNITGVLRELLAARASSGEGLAGARSVLAADALDPLIRQSLLDRLLHHLVLLETTGDEYRLEGDDLRLRRALVAARIHVIEVTGGALEWTRAEPHDRQLQEALIDGSVSDLLQQAMDAGLAALAESETSDAPRLEREAEIELVVQTILSIGMSSIDTETSRSDVHETRMRLARTALAVERYAAARGGAVPEKLEELVPDYADELPVDPFTGRPFSYRASDEGYELKASEAAFAAWDTAHRGDFDPVLDWSRPRRDTGR